MVELGGFATCRNRLYENGVAEIRPRPEIRGNLWISRRIWPVKIAWG